LLVILREIQNVHRSFNNESRYPEPFIDDKTAGFFSLLKLWPSNCTFKYLCNAR